VRIAQVAGSDELQRFQQLAQFGRRVASNTARKLGITVPQALLVRVDDVIQ
jgi:hypothetical protein